MWYDYQRFGMIIDVTTIHKTPDDVNVTTISKTQTVYLAIQGYNLTKCKRIETSH